MKKPINFFGLATLSLGSQKLEDGDMVLRGSAKTVMNVLS